MIKKQPNLLKITKLVIFIVTILFLIFISYKLFPIFLNLGTTAR